jgi:hypothetical protein
MLRFADSLALTREQSEKVQARQKKLIAQADSVFGDLAKHLASLPMNFNAKEAATRVKNAQDDMWNIIYAERSYLLELSPRDKYACCPGDSVRW